MSYINMIEICFAAIILVVKKNTNKFNSFDYKFLFINSRLQTSLKINVNTNHVIISLD